MRERYKEKEKNPVSPGKHYLYPERHIKAVESRDCCSETGSSVLPHEKLPAKYLRDTISIHVQ